MIVCLNGKFLPHEEAQLSVLDNGVLFGDGFYDTMRTYGGVVLELEQHLDRLEKSAKLTGIDLPCSRAELKSWIEETVKRNGFASSRTRATLTRGVNGFDFLSCKSPNLFVTCEELVANAADYEKGVTAFTMNLQRVFPEIKTLGLTAMMVAYREILPKGGYEALLVDQLGFVTEGASTNLFVVKDGVLKTPKNKMLPGLTRARVIQLAGDLGLSVVVEDFKATELLTADEIFLTNRPREIIPVVELDGKKVKDGQVGVLTRKVMEAYQNYVRQATAR